MHSLFIIPENTPSTYFVPHYLPSTCHTVLHLILATTHTVSFIALFHMCDHQLLKTFSDLPNVLLPKSLQHWSLAQGNFSSALLPCSAAKEVDVDSESAAPGQRTLRFWWFTLSNQNSKKKEKKKKPWLHSFTSQVQLGCGHCGSKTHLGDIPAWISVICTASHQSSSWRSCDQL